MVCYDAVCNRTPWFRCPFRFATSSIQFEIDIYQPCFHPKCSGDVVSKGLPDINTRKATGIFPHFQGICHLTNLPGKPFKRNQFTLYACYFLFIVSRPWGVFIHPLQKPIHLIFTYLPFHHLHSLGESAIDFTHCNFLQNISYVDGCVSLNNSWWIVNCWLYNCKTAWLSANTYLNHLKICELASQNQEWVPICTTTDSVFSSWTTSNFYVLGAAQMQSHMIPDIVCFHCCFYWQDNKTKGPEMKIT